MIWRNDHKLQKLEKLGLIQLQVKEQVQKIIFLSGKDMCLKTNLNTN